MINTIIHKNKVKEKTGSTTITVKVPEDFKLKWDKFCLDNNINKSKTLTATLSYIMDNNG
ncbi:MAG TPA: hypothetical protein ENK75_05865 [Saprospiraceae bacterium]|nr:hypothetical protein [Saprospiraceae bacterium]